MEKVKEYLLVTEVGTKDFTERVNTSIKQGWQPFGSISSVFFTMSTGNQTVHAIQFSQAMVK
jgi:hypothetical protein